MFQRIWTPFVERSLSSILKIVSLLFLGRLGGAVNEQEDEYLWQLGTRVATRQFLLIRQDCQFWLHLISIFAFSDTNNYFMSDT